MCSFKLIYFIIFLLNVYKTKCLISDKRLCVNEECSVPISLAKTLLRYSSPELSVLSFKPNDNVKIFSKEAGSRQDLWGAEIDGKRGYVPKNMVREYKVLAKPTKIVDTELLKQPEVPITKPPEEKVDPDKVKEPYEVIDGTTLYFDPESIAPSSTENPVLSTATNSLNNQKTPGNDEVKEADSNLEQQQTSEENKHVDKQENAAENPVPPVEDVGINAKESLDKSIFSTFKEWINDDEPPEDDEDIEGDDDYNDDEEEEEEEEDETSKESSTVDANIEKNETGDSTITFDENLTENKEIDYTSTGETDYPTPSNGEMIENKKINDIDAVNSTITSGENLLEKKEFGDKFNLNSTENQELIDSLKPKTDDGTKSTVIEEKIPEDINISNKNEVDRKSSEELTKPEPTLQKSSEITVKTEEITTANEIVPNLQNNLKDTIEVKEDSSNKIETIQSSEEVKVEKREENIETTTVLTSDDEEILPIALDYVTPNPIEIADTSEVIPPINLLKGESKLFDKKSNDIKPDDSLNKLSKNSHLPLPTETDSQSNKENLFGNDVEEKLGSSESNVEVNTPTTSSSKEIGENVPELVTSEEVETKELPPVPDTKSPEIPPTGWYGNANTNIDTSKSNENTEIPQPQDYDIPSDIQIDSLRKSEGVLSNNLIGENQDEGILIEETVLKPDSGGFFAGLFSFFERDTTSDDPNVDSSPSTPIGNADKLFHENSQHSIHKTVEEGYCMDKRENCDVPDNSSMLDKLAFLINSDVLLYLVTTAISCIIFLFVYMLIDKSSREAPLVKKINHLEKELLISLKEKDLLQEGATDLSNVSTEEVDRLKRRLEETEIVKQNLEMQVLNLEQEVDSKKELEEQIESLERELETSTEVGMELNKIISEMLNPSNGGDKLKENVEQLQRQLSEQKWIINDITKSLSDKETENAELQLQLNESKKKSSELQKKLDEIVDQILKIEKERDQQQKSFQEEISTYQQKYSDEIMKEEMLNADIQILKTQLAEAKRKAELKIKEYQSLKDSLNGIKSIKNDKEALQSLLDVTTLRAELEQLKSENESYSAQLKQEEAAKIAFEKKCQAVIEEKNSLLNKYQESDKLKVEANMKLEVLNNYFKKREEELQSEILKYKSIWDAKEGEATSTTERIKLMTEEIENYKSQNETLKQEIVSQEIDLKSQISILEKKVHENWLTSRQMERKLEDAKHEAAQLRNRLTLRERAVIDERMQNRLQSPLDQNGELTLSPPPIESPTSPLLFGGRDHMTKSPPLPGLPPFLPPPPGAPFMPPPLHGMAFMPPPPAMFPGDHRPPPLGRMSSPPPLNSRYSPDTSAFSPYERNTPSPPYDSEYGASPPPMSGYSPYNSRDDRRDYKRPMHVSNGRNNKGSLMSSGSEHSNDSLDKINRKHSSKMV